MTNLFETFLKEKEFLENRTDKTLKFYRDSYRAFQVFTHADPDKVKADPTIKIDPPAITSQNLKRFVMVMAEKGLTVGARNAYARGVNSFLAWLHREGHTEEKLSARIVSEPKRVLKTYTDEDVEKLLRYKPQTFGERRTIAILTVMIDTGIRFSEAAGMLREGIDFENLLISVIGKGRKQRIIPVSRETRKVLYRWLKEHDHDLVFGTRSGDMLEYHNLRRDFLTLLKNAGIQKSEGSFHAFRRFFGKSYTESGGNLFYLQKMLGHETLEQTKKYVEIECAALSRQHKASSPVERLKGRR